MTARSCVVFDIDDTLYLERDYVRSGLMATGQWLQEQTGVAGFFDRGWNAFEDGTRKTIFNLVLRELGIEDSPALVGRLVEVYRRHDPQIELIGDARECLDELRGGVRLGVVTDGPAVSQRNKASALELHRWHPEMIFTAELGSGMSKPNPRAFEMIERRTSCSGTHCVYVADNPAKDFAGPKGLGWRTVRVRRTGGLHFEVDGDDHVDAELGDLSSLPQLIARAAVASEGSQVPC